MLINRKLSMARGWPGWAGAVSAARALFIISDEWSKAAGGIVVLTLMIMRGRNAYDLKYWEPAGNAC